MPFGSVQLIPGVNVERTPTLLRAGISSSNLIRFRDLLVQKYGGWAKFFASKVNGTPRDLHAWQDLNQDTHLLIGTTSMLGIISDGALLTITPQDLTTDPVPEVSTTASSSIVEITDPNVTNVTTFDAVFFNVPISQGGLILDGLYPIVSITGTHSYKIDTGIAATSTQTNPTATNNSTAPGNPTLHFGATPSWVVQGMLIYDLDNPTSIPSGTTVSSTTGTTVLMSNNATGAGVSNGDHIIFTSIPIFTTSSGSSAISVEFIGHGVSAGDKVVFPKSTTGNGVTVIGEHTVLSVTDANNFIIQASGAATASGSFPMNGGSAELVYHIALGPTAAGVGWGLGNYGAGNYGFGTGAGSPQTGSPISAVDWTSDNWGEIVLACPQNQGIYYFDPTGGFGNASLIATAPPFNRGIFVSMSQQMVIAYGSSVHLAIGYAQQPLLVQWCTIGDFFNWTDTPSTFAGNFTIPTGSELLAGMAAPNQNLLWTDLDCWAMNFINLPDVFGFNKIGAGAGTVSGHAVQSLRGGTYWMGSSNFYSYTGAGVNVLPCPVWDAVFQNLNTDFVQNVRGMPNTPFNEVGWLYPSAASVTGECDSYVKMNITEPGQPWDYGSLPRSAWIDQNILGMPIGASPQGFVYQHETTNNADGIPLSCTFTTGFFYLAEGEDFVVVDQILPDFKWAEFTGGPSASIEISFNVVNYPGETPRVYGPYTVTQATKYITTRFRGRLVSITITSGDLNSFWRIGSIKYRYAPAGRR